MVINNYKKRIIQTIFISLICAFFIPALSISESSADVLEDILNPNPKNYCGTIPSNVQRGQHKIGDIIIRNVFAVEATSPSKKAAWESELNIFLIIQNDGEEDTLESFKTSMDSEIFFASEKKGNVTLQKFKEITLPKSASIIYRGLSAYLKIKTINNNIPVHSTFSLTINFKRAGSISLPVPILTHDEFIFIFGKNGLKDCKKPFNRILQTPKL